jgi:hypothetical protein
MNAAVEGITVLGVRGMDRNSNRFLKRGHEQRYTENVVHNRLGVNCVDRLDSPQRRVEQSSKAGTFTALGDAVVDRARDALALAGGAWELQASPLYAPTLPRSRGAAANSAVGAT